MHEMYGAEIIAQCGAIKTVNDVVQQIEKIVEILKDDIRRICKAKGYAHILNDFDFVFAKAAEETVKTLKKVTAKGEKLKMVQEILDSGDISFAIKKIVERLVANSRNVFDERYKRLYYDIPQKVTFADWLGSKEQTKEIHDELEIEKIRNLPIQKRIEAIKKVWEDAIFDFDFDGEDLNNICKIANVPIHQILKDEVELKIKAEKTKQGNIQLCFAF